jgi:hypothetical protein
MFDSSHKFSKFLKYEQNPIQHHSSFHLNFHYQIFDLPIHLNIHYQQFDLAIHPVAQYPHLNILYLS